MMLYSQTTKQILILFFIAGSILPLSVLSQSRNIKFGDKYFTSGQYKSALAQYRKAYHKNRVLRRSDYYQHYYALFRIAESKRLLNDTTCRRNYKKIIDHYCNLTYPDTTRLDTRVILFAAEAEMNLGEYTPAEDYYKQACDTGDSIPDQYKFGYAYSSLKQNRFGQAAMLLREIKNKQLFEPAYSSYLQMSAEGSSKNMSRSMNQNDTLTLIMTYGGCYGTTTHIYDIIKRADAYSVLVYKSVRNWEKGRPEINFIKTLSETEFIAVVNFESELRNHDQYKDASWSTAYDKFALETKSGNFNVEITYDAIGVGFELEKLLKGK